MTDATETTTPPKLSKPEWDALHDKLFNQAKDKFFEALEQLDGYNWPVPRLIYWILSYHELRLDCEIIDAVNDIETKEDDADAEADGHECSDDVLVVRCTDPVCDPCSDALPPARMPEEYTAACFATPPEE